MNILVFANIKALLLILLIPLFYIVYWWYRHSRKKRLSKFGNPDMVDALMPERSKNIGWVKLTLFSLAWLFLVIGLARPQIGAKLKETSEKGAEIIIALDVSNSMLAKDYSPNRLERAKMDISRIVDRLHSDRIGLVIFAGESFVQLPITADYVSAKIFLSSISTNSVPIQGTDLADAIYRSEQNFSEEAYQGENNKAIILISDGEDHEGEAIEAARDAAANGIKVFCVGVGTPEGVPIEMDNGQMLRDNEGNIVVSKLNEQILKEIADAGNGAYIKATDGSFGLSEILGNIRELEKTSYKTLAFAEYDEQYMYFFAIALIFLLLEFLIGNRKMKKTLFLITLLFCLTSYQAYAQADRREVKKGNNFFKKEHYKQAEVEYRKGLLKDSMSIVANYNLGNTLYKMNDWQSALNIYQNVADSVSRIPYSPDWNGVTTTLPKVDRKTRQIPFDKYQGKATNASDYFFNLGNYLLAAQQYDKAVEAFKQSLLRNPGDMTAKANYEYAKKKMKDQEQNKDQNKDQNQDQNQDQNKDQNKNQNQGEGKMTPQAAQQVLQAIQDKENQTQQKVNNAKAVQAKSKKKEKNW